LEDAALRKTWAPGKTGGATTKLEDMGARSRKKRAGIFDRESRRVGGRERGLFASYGMRWGN